jgi:hypothetical protein
MSGKGRFMVRGRFVRRKLKEENINKFVKKESRRTPPAVLRKCIDRIRTLTPRDSVQDFCFALNRDCWYSGIYSVIDTIGPNASAGSAEWNAKCAVISSETDHILSLGSFAKHFRSSLSKKVAAVIEAYASTPPCWVLIWLPALMHSIIPVGIFSGGRFCFSQHISA